MTPGGVPGVLNEHVVSALPLAITNSEHCMVQWVTIIWVGEAIVCSNDTALVRMDVYIISINSDGKRLSIKGFFKPVISSSDLLPAFDFDAGSFRGRVMAFGLGSIFWS